jgi:hypothetical protein
MKIKKMMALAGMTVLSMGIMAVYAVGQQCQNQGYVTGWQTCKAVDNCSNHSSPGTCTTAQINWDKRNTSTVSGEYINLYDDVCTQDVTCNWNVFCSEVAGSGGDSHNAQFPDQEDCN